MNPGPVRPRRALAALGLALMVGLAPSKSSAQAADSAYITAPSLLSAEDQAAIEGVVARMNHAIDVEDYPLYASFYAEDGVIDSGFGEPVAGHPAIVASLEASAPLITNKRHAATNLVIFGEGDEATAVYYLVVLERAAGLTVAGTAVITDTFRREAEGWRMVRHQTRMDPATLASLPQ